MIPKQKVIEFENKKIIVNEGLTCPACSSDMNISYTAENIPHFGKTHFIGYACTKCNYKNTELIPVDEKEPIEQSVKIENEKELSIKIVRGTDTTLEIKEVGISLEPGARASAFYTNIEGVLQRFKGSVLSMQRYYKILESEAKSDNERKEIKLVQKKLIDKEKKLNRYIDGKAPFTLILRAEKGYGKVLSPKAKNLLKKPKKTNKMANKKK